MLFHLKEPDYKKEAPNDTPTRFYGRTPQQILTCLDYYTERARKDGTIDHPNLTWWLKRKFSIGDIEQIEKGEFIFFTGMISFAEGDKNLFEEIRIGEDLSVYVPEENIGSFALWRRNIMQMERGRLYKLQNPIGAFMNISFVPQDIAMAIMGYDLTPYTDAIKKDMRRRKELSKHPNIKVDGLQKILTGARTLRIQRKGGNN